MDGRLGRARRRWTRHGCHQLFPGWEGTEKQGDTLLQCARVRNADTSPSHPWAPEGPVAGPRPSPTPEPSTHMGHSGGFEPWVSGLPPCPGLFPKRDAGARHSSRPRPARACASQLAGPARACPPRPWQRRGPRPYRLFWKGLQELASKTHPSAPRWLPGYRVLPPAMGREQPGLPGAARSAQARGPTRRPGSSDTGTRSLRLSIN